MPHTSTLVRSIEPGRIFDDSIKVRFENAQNAIELTRGKILFGNGINTYDSVNKTAFPEKEQYFYAHNCYLQMLVELGVTGVLTFLLFLIFLFRKSLRFVRREASPKLITAGLICSVTTMAISFLFDTHFYNSQLSVLFWFYCGMAAGSTEY